MSEGIFRRRLRMGILMSAIVTAIYFGFLLFVAFLKESAATQIVPGLSVGILLGALVIVAAWLATWFYVAWTNRLENAGGRS